MTITAFSEDNTRATATEHTTTAVLTSGTGVAGSYIQMIASTGLTYNYLLVILDDPNTSNDYDIDIAIGAGGSEVDIIEDLTFHVDLTGNNQISISYPIKIRIPIGTRIAARVTATNNTDTIECHALGQGF